MRFVTKPSRATNGFGFEARDKEIGPGDGKDASFAPASRKLGSTRLYSALLRYFRKGRDGVEDVGPGEKVATAHPAELMRRIMACADLSSLDKAITDHGQLFDDKQVPAAMHRVCKKFQQHQVTMAQRMMQDLSVLALREINNMQAKSLSNVLRALSEVGGPVNPALVHRIMREAKLKLPNFNSQELSISLRAAANLGIEDKAFTDAWLREAKLKLPDFNAQELSNSLRAAANLGIEDKAFTDAWLCEAKLKLPDFNAQELSNSLRAAANLGIEDKAFTDAWLREAKVKLPNFNAQELSNSLRAAANLGIEDKAFTDAWLREAKLKLHDFNSQALSNSLWAAANLGIADKAFTDAWLREAKLKLPDFNPQQLFNSQWAAAKLGIKDDDFAATWLREAKHKLCEFDVQALSHILSPAADGGTEAPTVLVVGDASSKALAAYTPNGELRHPINQPFTKEELKAVQEDKWSSTARELAVVKLALEVIEEQRPGYLSGKRFQYGTDCEVAVMMMRMVVFSDALLGSPFAHGVLTSCSGKYAHEMATAMGMKGGSGTIPLVKDIRSLCNTLGVELDVVWRRRNHPEQQVADHLSKVEDEEDWSLHQGVYLKVLEHPCLQGRRPTLDVFASGSNTKVEKRKGSKFLKEPLNASFILWGKQQEAHD
eukprot:gene11113-biopygen12570